MRVSSGGAHVHLLSVHDHVGACDLERAWKIHPAHVHLEEKGGGAFANKVWRGMLVSLPLTATTPVVYHGTRSCTQVGAPKSSRIISNPKGKR